MKQIKPILTLALLFTMVLSAVAQGTIRGTVKDDTGEPAIGATVAVKGSAMGASTDIDGTFEIKNVPAKEVTLTVTFVGYITQEKTVTISQGEVTVDFNLESDTKALEEVVVVGYGVQRKRDLVGSVSRVDKVNDIVGSSFENTLQGKAAGVNITQSSGNAGGGAVVRIRGVSSVSSSGEPLYVVDGVVIDVNNFLTGTSGAQNYNPLSSINPNDIENVDVLKDASATAIYGSRGANGVIIITTKRGKNGKPKFNFSARFGGNKETNRVSFMNAEQLLLARQIAWENDGNSGRAKLPDGINLTYDDITNPQTGKVVNTDWIDQVLRTGLQQDYNLSGTWGNKFINLYAGASATNNNSFMVGNTFDRKSGRVNLDITPIKGLKIGLSGSISQALTDRLRAPWEGGGLGNAQTYALPFYPVHYDELIQNQLLRGNMTRVAELRADSASNGNWFNLGQNPIAQQELRKNRVKEVRTINNVNIAYTGVKNLTIIAQGNYEYARIGENTTEDTLLSSARRSYTGLSESQIKNWSAFGTAEYVFKMPTNHNLRILAGTEYTVKGSQTRFQGYQITHDNPEGFISQFGAPSGENVDTIPSSYYDWRALGDNTKFLSFFGRINYDYKGKYFAQITFRRDASSLFGNNRRWGNFPALGLGYVISEEPFLKGNKVVNFLKFKTSWGRRGIVGGIGQDEQYETFNDLGQYGGRQTFVQNKLPNKNIGWENNTMIDAGVEFGLFNDRLTGEIGYYNGTTTDAFVNVNIQASSGLEDLTFLKNSGKIRNSGWELALTSNNIKTSKFLWKTRVIGNYNINKLVDAGGATPDALDGGFGDIRGIQGYPLAVDFKVPYVGVDPATGRPMYTDVNGNITYNPNLAFDRRPGVSLFSPWTASITNEFSYKGFDFSFMFYGSFGGYIYDDGGKRYNSIVTNSNLLTEMLTESWSGPGDDAKYPALTMDSRNWGWTKPDDNNSTLYTYKADFIRLRNVTLGYNIPLKTKNVTSRVYLMATNLLTFTPYPLWDPEVARDRENTQQRNIGGVNVTYLTPPQAKSLVFGIDVGF